MMHLFIRLTITLEVVLPYFPQCDGYLQLMRLQTSRHSIELSDEQWTSNLYEAYVINVQ